MNTGQEQNVQENDNCSILMIINFNPTQNAGNKWYEDTCYLVFKCSNYWIYSFTQLTDFLSEGEEIKGQASQIITSYKRLVTSF